MIGDDFMQKRLRKLIAASIMVSALTFTPQIDYFPVISVAHAEIKPYTGVGRYVASDFDDPKVAIQRAKLRAEQDAKQQAGVYLRNYSRTSNSRLTEDDILTLTNKIVNEISFTYQKKSYEAYDNNSGKSYGEVGIMYEGTIKVNIDTDGIKNWLKRDEQNKIKLVHQNETIQKSEIENNEQIENLKEKYYKASSQNEKDKIKNEVAKIDRSFLAIQKVKDGDKLFYAGDYKGAIRFYGQAIALDPNNTSAYNNRGMAYQNLKEYDNAIADFNKVLELDPKASITYNNRGSIYNDLKNYKLAIKDYNKAIKLDSKYTFAYSNRGVAYANLDDYKKAQADYNKAIELDPNDSAVYNNRSVMYQNLKEYDLALKDNNKAIELDPNFAAAYNNRGTTYGYLNDNQKALADYNKAIEFESDNATFYSNRGTVYDNLKDYNKAIKDHTKAIELESDNAAFYGNRGVAYEHAKEYKLVSFFHIFYIL